VILTKPFWCSKFEVTQGQWRQVMGSSPTGGASADPDTPVSLLLWDECQDFVRKLCQIEGVPEGTYRLLTEAEWEYACRAGTVSAYCCGDTEYALGQYAWYLLNGGSQLHPVGQKKANAFGLHDMHGNVWEWCQDWWYVDYPSGTVTNPAGPASGGSRIFRGGAVNDNAKLCRSAERNKSSPTFGYGNVGLRLARVVPSDVGSLSGKLTILTFEGIATNDDPWIPDGYGGLSWSGSFCVHSPGGAAVSGYVNGTVSPVSAAYNGGAYPVECSDSSFTFVGAYLTGAWRDDLQIEISGYRSGSRLYNRIVSANSQYPTWCRFDYEDVDRVTFASSGGRHNGVFTSDGAQFVMDDMVIKR